MTHARLALSLALLLTAREAVAHEPHDKGQPHQHAPAADAPTKAKGVVYHDKNKNRVRDDGEPGVEGVRVSNGRAIVKTDAEGRYELGVDDDTILFVIKPRDWMTPLNAEKLPQFYYVHKPNGSPKDLRFAGVAPTGPLPASVDFPLDRHWEPAVFRALFFGDTQPRDVKEVEYIAHDVIEPLVAENKKIGAAFGVTLGDVVFDDLSVFEPLNRVIAMLDIPWYNVIGNHDVNKDAKTDKHANETWERIYGPSYYAFDHGPVHFLAVDDIRWAIGENGRGGYTGGLGETQMEFIRNDLAMVPEDQLVVIMMHIPLKGVADRKELYDLIAKRPFAMSISAHTHYQEHHFIGEEDGFQGPQKHHHVVNVTVCGSWWRGAPDERGIPHTTMRDGAPNGYSIFTFDGHEYDIEFRSAARPQDYQMNIYAPEKVSQDDAGATEVLVNVFAGSERSKVDMRFDEGGDWVPMEHVAVEDPAYVAVKAREDSLLVASTAQKEAERAAASASAAKANANADVKDDSDARQGAQAARRRQVMELPFIPLPDTIKSPHIWRGKLPAKPAKGTRVIHVRTTDMFGKSYTDRRSISIH